MRECEDDKTRLELRIGYKIYWAYMILQFDGHVKIFKLVGASADIGLDFFPKPLSLKMCSVVSRDANTQMVWWCRARGI